MKRLFTGSVLLFVSGFCALVYQTVWLRELRVVFGASTPATSAVLGIFMGGLGFGALLFGRRAERTAQPLMLYGNLELVISVLAAVSPLLIDAVGAIYLAMGGSVALGGFLATVVRLVFATVILIGPTLLMGGTLPAMARAMTAQEDHGRRALALVYGINTLGAVAGVVVTTFVFFEVFGLQAALWIAACINALLAMTARSLARSEPLAPIASSSEAAAPPDRLVVVAAFVAGFVFLFLELVWYRLTAPLLGGSTYSFSMVLAVALFGIGIGGVLYAWRSREATWGDFAITAALEGALILVAFGWGDDFAFFVFYLREWAQVSFGLLVSSWIVVLAIVVLPAAVVSGYQFPLLIALRGHGQARVATDAGVVYAANTVGSILGSIVGGFLLLPGLGASNGLRLAGLLMVVIGAVALVRALASARAVAVVAGLAVVAVTLAGQRGPGPVWRGTAIGAGRAELESTTDAARARRVHDLTRTARNIDDGVESGLAVSQSDGIAILVNGKSDGHSAGDAQTMVGAVLLPALLHGAPKKGFVIGLGTGQSAGWLAAIPTMEETVVVELEEKVVPFAEACAPTNMNALSNPRVKLIIGDGREVLETARDVYDVIMSEPSNPYRAGLAGFYSVDFYERVRERLAPTGKFAQWIQAYDVDATAVQTAVATIRSVFPHVTLWRLGTNDLLLIASAEPQALDVARSRALLVTEPYRTAFARLFWLDSLEDVMTLFVGNERLTTSLAESWSGGLNSDDLPILEFKFARSVGRSTSYVLGELTNIAERLDAQLLPTTNGAIDWTVVAARRGRSMLPFVTPRDRGGDATGAPDAMRGPSAAGAVDEARPPPTSPGDSILALRAMIADPALVGDDALVEPHLRLLEERGFLADARLFALLRTLVRGLPPNDAIAAFADAMRVDPWLPLLLTQDVVEAFRMATAVAPKEIVARLSTPFVTSRLDNARVIALIHAHGELLDADCAPFFTALGDGITWGSGPLAARVACYERHAPDLVDDARLDLERFQASQAPGFVVTAPDAP